MRFRNFFIPVLIIMPLLFVSIFLNPGKGTENVSSDIAQGSSFKIMLSLEKPVYLEGENVWLKIVFQNTGATVDSIANLGEEDILRRLKVEYMGGLTPSYRGSVGNRLETAYTRVEPGGEIEFFTPINSFFGFESLDSSITEIFASYYFPAGNYSVSLNFDVDEENGRGKISSNDVNFAVAEPEGIEKEAFREMVRLYKMPLGKKSETVKRETVVGEYEKFIDDYPNSIYLENIFFVTTIMRDVRGIRYDDSIIGFYKKFIEKLPDSHIVTSAVIGGETYYRFKKEDFNKAKEFLEYVKTNYPGTIASDKAEEIISSDTYNK